MGKWDAGFEEGAGVVAGVDRKFLVDVLARLVAEVGSSASGERRRSRSMTETHMRQNSPPAIMLAGTYLTLGRAEAEQIGSPASS